MDKRFDYSQAAAEADRCLLCHDAPCSKGCPANTDPGKFIRKFKLKNIKGAIRTIKENNIMGGACGVLCPTSKLCEKECCSSELDRPIRIGKIQEFLVRHGKEIDFQVFEKPEALLERIIKSSSREGDVILDPFCGSGTTLAVAERTGRKWIGIDISEKAVELAEKRLNF